MASLVLAAGYPVVVCSRSAASRGRLVARGAREASDPAACARAADLVFSSIPDDAALRAIALGFGGVLANARPGAVFTDTSTVSAEVSAEIAREAGARGVPYLRVPISGNAASVRRGEATALVSGPLPAWDAVKAVVQTFTDAQVYLGAGEEARVMKLVVNALVVNFAQAMAEALTLGRKAGLDWGLMLDTLAQSTLTSPWLRAKVALLKPRDFTPTMTTRLILKDIDLMLAAARAGGVAMPLTATTRELMQATVDAGYGDEDYTAAIKRAEQLAGLSSDDLAPAGRRLTE
jgi:3-hydroxyisobutyrate dehydrogenase-like beta-hydroxyacid dehydrogenase